MPTFIPEIDAVQRVLEDVNSEFCDDLSDVYAAMIDSITDGSPTTDTYERYLRKRRIVDNNDGVFRALIEHHDGYHGGFRRITGVTTMSAYESALVQVDKIAVETAVSLTGV